MNILKKLHTNCFQVISYFAMVGASQQKKGKSDKKNASIEDQIVQTNPVLEAYGMSLR